MCTSSIYFLVALTLGFVHRDLKPDNILLDERGHIVLADFGVSLDIRAGRRGTEEMQKRIGEQQGDSKKNGSGGRRASLVGTVTYLPPELLLSTPIQSGEAADFWSLGIDTFCFFFLFFLKDALLSLPICSLTLFLTSVRSVLFLFHLSPLAYLT